MVFINSASLPRRLRDDRQHVLQRTDSGTCRLGAHTPWTHRGSGARSALQPV